MLSAVEVDPVAGAAVAQDLAADEAGGVAVGVDVEVGVAGEKVGEALRRQVGGVLLLLVPAAGDRAGAAVDVGLGVVQEVEDDRPGLALGRAVDVRVGHVVRRRAAVEVDAVDLERELEAGAREVQHPGARPLDAGNVVVRRHLLRLVERRVEVERPEVADGVGIAVAFEHEVLAPGAERDVGHGFPSPRADYRPPRNAEPARGFPALRPKVQDETCRRLPGNGSALPPARSRASLIVRPRAPRWRMRCAYVVHNVCI